MSKEQKKNENKDIYLKLALHLREHAEEGIAIAFSGGVDSSLLLKVACDIGSSLEQPVLAVTFKTKLHPQGEIQTAKMIASKYGALHRVILVDEFSDPEIVNNPIDRCYRCKSLLFRTLASCADREGYHYLVDGTNYDDKSTYRPGMKALEELGIHSPLMELEITKAQIRSLAADLGILSSNRPSAPCLATRLPYGTKLDVDLLAKIDRGERYFRENGFYNVRLRLHRDILRIEVDQEDFVQLVEQREAYISMLKDMGFHYITMDIEGFRSGSMDINILKNR